MEYSETMEQKEAKVVNQLSSDYKDLKEACQGLLDYVHNKYPGEELTCPHMRKIEKLIS
jgi:hypothetical protein